jgi:hypothetical protein
MKWRNDTHFMEAVYVAFLVLCCAFLSSCAHDPGLDQKIAAETAKLPVLGPNARAEEASKTISDAPLSAKQKDALETIALSTGSELEALREENAKLRLLLVRQLVNPRAEDREIEAIKRRILETDQKANKRWLAALEDARDVLGRKNEQDAKFYKVFMHDPVTPEDTIGPHVTK